MTGRLLSWFALLVSAGVLIGGCSDPRFDAESQRRWARIDRYVTDAQLQEAKRPRRLADMNLRAKQDYKGRQQKFRTNLEIARRMHEQDVQRWHKERAERQARFRDELQGDPTNIDKTVPEVFY